MNIFPVHNNNTQSPEVQPLNLEDAHHRHSFPNFGRLLLLQFLIKALISQVNEDGERMKKASEELKKSLEQA